MKASLWLAIVLTAGLSGWRVVESLTQPRKSPASIIYSNETLGATIESWKWRDGAQGHELSDYWCDFAAANAPEFFAVMALHQRVFQEWLDRLGELSLRDFGSCVDVQCRKEALIAALRTVRTGESEVLRQRLLKRLNELTVTRVD